MVSLKQMLAVAVCLLPLAGCSTASPTVRPVAARGSYTNSTTPEIASDMATGNSVQVFSLDGPAPAPVMPPAVAAPALNSPPVTGVISSRDSGVTVYPLDGTGASDGMTPPPMPGAPQSITPDNMMTPEPGAPMDDMHGPAPVSSARSPYPVMADGGVPARVYFRNGSAVVNMAGREIVRGVASANAARSLIRVEGHASSRTATADPVKKRIINLKISMDRAFNVSRQLIRDGVPAAAIQTTAWGDTRPAIPVSGMGAEAASRRVEIFPVSGPATAPLLAE